MEIHYLGIKKLMVTSIIYICNCSIYVYLTRITDLDPCLEADKRDLLSCLCILQIVHAMYFLI